MEWESNKRRERRKKKPVTSITAKIRSVNLVAEHVGVVTMCSTTEFTVLMFAVFDVRVYNTCLLYTSPSPRD